MPLLSFTRRQLVGLFGALTASVGGLAAPASRKPRRQQKGNHEITTPTGILFSDPRVKPLSVTGVFQAGCSAQFYLTGGTIPTDVYADGLLTTPLSQPIDADSAGRFPAIYMDPSVVYRVIIKTAGGSTISDTDPYVVPGVQAFTAAEVGAALFPQTAAEAGRRITPTNHAIPPVPANPLRYGDNTTPGTTDMTAAIQTAILVAGTGSCRGEVYIPPGAYLVTQSLNLGPTGSLKAVPMYVRGAGQSTQLINACAANHPTFNMSGVSQWRLADMLLTGNSVNKNDGIWVDGSSVATIRWRIEGIVCQMAGYAIKLKNTNSGVIRNCMSWPDNNSNALTVAQTVTTSDISHHLYLTGGFVHDVTIENFDGLASKHYAANSRGIKCDATNAYGIRIIGGSFSGETGSNDEIGLDLRNLTAAFIVQPVHESSRMLLTNCTNCTVSGNAIGVGGGLVVAASSVQNLFIGMQEATASFDVSSIGNISIACAYGTVTDAGMPANRFMGNRGTDQGSRIRKALIYSASMTPNCAVQDTAVITVTNSSAMTINPPSNPTDGFRLTFAIKNTSGGAMGTITWAGIYKMSAWTNPANGQNRSITFEYDATDTAWRQVGQTGADVPN